MLYEFHKTQNEKNPGSLLATYLVYGTRKSDEQDGDVEMTDSVSDKDETFSESVPTKTLELVREETLKGKFSIIHRIIAFGSDTDTSLQRPCKNMMRSRLFMSTVWRHIPSKTCNSSRTLLNW